MKTKLRNERGVAILTVIIVTLVAILGGGALCLGVNSAITGDPFLQPFEDMGLIELEDDDDDDDKKDKDRDEDEDEDRDEDEDYDYDNDEDYDYDDDYDYDGDDDYDYDYDDDYDYEDELTHYHASIDFDDYLGGESLEYSDYIYIDVDFYATETELTEIKFEFDFTDFLEKYYDAYEDDMVAAGYTYASFRDEMMAAFEVSFVGGFESSGSQMEDYFDVDYPTDEIIVLTITDDGVKNIYSNYGLEEGDSVQDILDGFEDALNIELEEV